MLLDIPNLVTAAVVSLYWWRVMRMAYKMRRRHGRAANLVPAERTGRRVRWVWLPVVCVWIVVPWWVTLGGGGRTWILRPIGTLAVLDWVSAAVAVFTYLATRICWRKMGRSWRMGIDPRERTELVCTGAFAYVRHPIYALSGLLVLCTVAVFPAPLLIAAASVHVLLLQWEARREEHHLQRVHGETYRFYLSQVGRFVPRSLRPGVPGR